MNVNQQQVDQIKDIRKQALRRLIERNEIENEAKFMKQNVIPVKDESSSLLKSVLKKNLTRKSRREW